MGVTIDAILFWGYAEPIDEERQDEEYESDNYPETPWSEAHGLPGIKWVDQQKLPYDVGYYGVGQGGGIYGYTAHFLAIREAFFKVSWHKIQVIDPIKFVVKPEWDSILRDAAKEWKIDLTGLTPGWHLAPLFLS